MSSIQNGPMFAPVEIPNLMPSVYAKELKLPLVTVSVAVVESGVLKSLSSTLPFVMSLTMCHSTRTHALSVIELVVITCCVNTESLADTFPVVVI